LELFRLLAYPLPTAITSDLSALAAGMVHLLPSVPFLWAERIGLDYTAQYFIPVPDLMRGYRFLAQVMEPFDERSSAYVIDQSEGLAFTLPPNLFEEGKGWTLDEEGLVAKAEQVQLLLKSSWR